MSVRVSPSGWLPQPHSARAVSVNARCRQLLVHPLHCNGVGIVFTNAPLMTAMGACMPENSVWDGWLPKYANSTSCLSLLHFIAAG